MPAVHAGGFDFAGLAQVILAVATLVSVLKGKEEFERWKERERARRDRASRDEEEEGHDT